MNSHRQAASSAPARAIQARGVEGVIIYVGNGKYCFRVYGDEFDFKDYDIMISDILVKIVDEDVYLHEKNSKLTLDYSPDTLGF